MGSGGTWPYSSKAPEHSPTHQCTDTRPRSPWSLQPETLYADPPIRRQAPAPGCCVPCSIYQWAPVPPQPPSLHVRIQPTYKKVSTNPKGQPASPTSRPTPALTHLEPLLQLPQDLAPYTRELTQAPPGLPEPCSQRPHVLPLPTSRSTSALGSPRTPASQTSRPIPVLRL